MDWGTIGGALAAAGLGAGAVWGWFLKQKIAVSQTDAEVSAHEAQRMAADAQHTLYKNLNDRVNSLEVELREVRAELSIERRHSRMLEKHIYRLEDLMRKNNLPVPERDYEI